MRTNRTLLLSAIIIVTGGLGCTTFNNARALEPGQAAAMVTMGGPFTNIPNLGTIPLPNVTVEGRVGVVEHVDVNAGVHLLPTLFGATRGHVGATWQLYDEPEPWFPVLSAGHAAISSRTSSTPARLRRTLGRCRRRTSP